MQRFLKHVLKLTQCVVSILSDEMQVLTKRLILSARGNHIVARKNINLDIRGRIRREDTR
jgi:hypothetical protein